MVVDGRRAEGQRPMLGVPALKRGNKKRLIKGTSVVVGTGMSISNVDEKLNFSQAVCP